MSFMLMGVSGTRGAAADSTTWDVAFTHADHTLTNGNKTVTATATATANRSTRTTHGSTASSSEKFYWEIEVVSTGGADFTTFVGVASPGVLNTYFLGQGGLGNGMTNAGTLSGLTGTGFSFTNGDILQLALDMSGAGSLAIAKNGGAYQTFTGSAADLDLTNLYPAITTTVSGNSFTIKTGSSEWTYSAPSGHVAIPTS